MEPNLLFSQLTAGAALAYLLQLIQKWDKLPWITQHTKVVTVAFRAVLALAATVGISFQWNGAAHTLMIEGLSASTIGMGLWHWFGQYAMQHGWGQLLNVGTTSKMELPMEIVDVKGNAPAK